MNSSRTGSACSNNGLLDHCIGPNFPQQTVRLTIPTWANCSLCRLYFPPSLLQKLLCYFGLRVRFYTPCFLNVHLKVVGEAPISQQLTDTLPTSTHILSSNTTIRLSHRQELLQVTTQHRPVGRLFLL